MVVILLEFTISRWRVFASRHEGQIRQTDLCDPEAIHGFHCFRNDGVIRSSLLVHSTTWIWCSQEKQAKQAPPAFLEQAEHVPSDETKRLLSGGIVICEE